MEEQISIEKEYIFSNLPKISYPILEPISSISKMRGNVEITFNVYSYEEDSLDDFILKNSNRDIWEDSSEDKVWNNY